MSFRHEQEELIIPGGNEELTVSDGADWRGRIASE